jgi:hypothetical protein
MDNFLKQVNWKDIGVKERVPREAKFAFLAIEAAVIVSLLKQLYLVMKTSPLWLVVPQFWFVVLLIALIVGGFEFLFWRFQRGLPDAFEPEPHTHESEATPEVEPDEEHY